MLRNEATGLLEFGESSECAEEAAFGGGDIAGEQLEYAGGEQGAFGLPGAGFQFAEAAHAPEVLGKFVDEDFFGGVDGLMLAAERGAEAIKFGSALFGEDELFGVEAVLEGVLGRALFTGFGAWAGGVLGVAAVGLGAIGFGGGRWLVRETHGGLTCRGR